MGDRATSYTTQIGDIPGLVGSRYVITLDSDTILSQDSTHRLIATLAHPLNRAELDPETGRVVAGYTVLQPRTEVQPTSVNATLLTSIFAGDAGLDLYTLAVSDVYQDFFGEGSFVGKGIYDVTAFHRSLAGRVPENALLSHDLFEGIHGRAGLVTDVVLYEDYPQEYLTYMHRQHRWWRGDWQLLPWLFPRVPSAPQKASAPRKASAPQETVAAQEGPATVENQLSVLDRWKILDNLRRSLRSPALLAFFMAGWLVLPGSPWLWTLTGLFISAMPLVTGLLTALSRIDYADSVPLSRHLARGVLAPMRIQVLRWLFSLVFLLYESVLALDAIGVTLVRLFISHRRLLQWVTAAHALRSLGGRDDPAVTWRRMILAPVVALLMGALIVVVDASAVLAAAPLLLLWFVSPQVAFWIGRPLETEEAPLTTTQRNILRRLARRTWLYFERFVGPEDHWLPPDHFQEDPRGLVAHRTSPTNIGLLLLSTLSAHDLGYIGPLTLVLRLRSTLDSMEQLERYRGHFLNWYETHDLGTLAPRYVSTVDSGNLAASLLTLKEGLRRLPQQRVPRWQRWEGLRDALGVLEEVLTSAVEMRSASGQPVTDDVAATIEALEAHLAHIRRQVRTARQTPARLPAFLDSLSGGALVELHRLITALLESGAELLPLDTLQGLRLWSERVHYHLRNMRDELDLLFSWLLPLLKVPELLESAARDTPVGKAWQAVRAALPPAPQLGQIPDVCREGREEVARILDLLSSTADADSEELREAREWCRTLMDALDQSRQRSESLLVGIQSLAHQAEAMVNGMDFGFLFDEHRQVFYLGYRVDTEKLDTNHYDLLASEARTASLIAIAKGEVPQSHWLHLSRPITEMEGMRALLSWNGSMFEYLMPDLFSRSYEGTLLAQTNRAVVQRQIAYGREQGVPWGVSES
ncbi:MAG: cellobiose phosphorylase, partial [Anaerolineae bacterium]|nr:cellobiose phosphorylase [Anaerolineae bacterium]